MRISYWSSDVCSSDLQSTARGDKRMTRVGAVIRKTSIDELPQLFNVLKGDMSIVGPRPHAPGSRAADKLFWEIDSRYWCRHATKPGLTGLAQVRGYRGATHHEDDLVNRLHSDRSEEHTSDLQSLMLNSYAVICLKKKKNASAAMPRQRN